MSEIEWQSIGPANMSGRITSIAVYEKDPTTWWAASASGGLLKTVNDGFTFQHQFDDQPVVSIGDVQVFQADPKIVWVGTGEANPRNSSSWGNGIYKSTDGGETWKHLGLDKTFQTGRIALHPTDPNIAYVGSLGRLWGENQERGIFKTTDGGETWEKVLFVDPRTGFVDLQMHPTNPEVLVAAAYERQRDGFDGNDPGKKFGPGAGIYRTEDGGKTWQEVTEGLPSCNMGRIGLSWSRSQPDHIFAIVESEEIGGGPEKLPFLGVRNEDADAGVRVTSVESDGPANGLLEEDDIILQVEGELVLDDEELNAAVGRRKVDDEVSLLVIRDGEKQTVKVKLGERPMPRRRGDEPFRPFSASLGGQQENRQDQQGENGQEYGGLYRSDDAGKTWTRINSINPRPMYYSQVRVDPTDENNIYILGTSLYKSRDGGKTFTDDGHGNEVHVDHHSLWIDPRDSRHIILGNDGGIYVTRDRMTTWDHHNHVAIGQFYHVGVGPQEDYNVYGGLQDNGSWGGPRRSRYGATINSDWFRIGGGDGFVCLVDPEDPDQLYSESQNGAMGRLNLRTGERGSIRPRPQRGTRYRFNWKTPFILSPHNSKIHYSAGNYVFRSLYKGDDVVAISPEITNTSQGSGSAISESGAEVGVLYAGTTDGAVWMTRDGGQNWEPIYSQPEPESDDENDDQEEGESEGEPSSQADASEGQTKPEEATEKPEAEAAKEMPAPVVEADSVAGSWVGTFESNDGEVVGQFDMELSLGEDGVVTGTISTDGESANIQNGIFDREDKTLSFEVETPMGTLAPEFLFRDQKLTAEVALPEGGVLKVEAIRRQDKQQGRVFTGLRQEGEADDADDQEGDESKQEETAEQESDSEAKSETRESTTKGKSDDEGAQAVTKVVAGSWQGEMIREGEVMSSFTMTLRVGAEGKITGSYETDRGDGQVIDGKYDAATGQLTLPIDTGRMASVITAKIEGSRFEGEMDFGGGRFVVDVRGQKTAATGSARPTAAVETKPLGEWMPGPRWVSSLEASRHQRGRCYISLDGHRSNDDGVYVFASEDYGKTWRSLQANLPEMAGSVRVIREDRDNPDVLYLGCEFSAWLSVDRGKTWTRFTGLPTVAVHEFAQHPTNDEIVAGTHGRSLWVANVKPIRQMTTESLQDDVSLYQPSRVIRWRSLPERGSNSTRAFAADSSDSDAEIYYRLGRTARSVVLSIQDIQGREVYRVEGETGAGLHKVQWDLRRGVQAGGGRRFRGPTAEEGVYRVQLQVNDQLYQTTLEIAGDPAYPDEDRAGQETSLWEEIESMVGEED